MSERERGGERERVQNQRECKARHTNISNHLKLTVTMRKDNGDDHKDDEDDAVENSRSKCITDTDTGKS